MAVFCHLDQLLQGCPKLISRHSRQHYRIKQGCKLTHFLFVSVHQALWELKKKKSHKIWKQLPTQSVHKDLQYTKTIVMEIHKQFLIQKAHFKPTALSLNKKHSPQFNKAFITH